MAEPRGAPNSTVNPAAIPVIVRILVSFVDRCQRPDSHAPNDPVVCTIGASGPMAPPAEMHSKATGIRERRSLMSSGPPMTWMLLTSSSTSPGLPRNRVIIATAAPTPIRMSRWGRVAQWVGHKALWSR